MSEARGGREVPEISIQGMMLCDAATIRDGLLSVLSAGITRLARRSYPAPIAAELAILLEAPTSADLAGKSLVLRITNVESGEAIAEDLEMAFDEAGYDVSQNGTKATMPVVVNMREMLIPSAGVYAIELIDSESVLQSLVIDAIDM